MKKYIITLLILITSTFSLVGQNNEEEAKKLEKILKDFAKAYQNLADTKDKASVLKFMSKRVSSVILNANVRDKVDYFRSDYDGFSRHLDQILRTPIMKVNYKIEEILRSYVSKNTGTVIYSVNFENIREGKVWVKGTETVAMSFRKVEDEWKIIHYTVLGFEDEKFIGTCYCELFASTSSIVTKTVIPQGKGYSNNNDEFHFTGINGEPAVQYDDKYYAWPATGEIWLLDEEQKKVEMVGRATRRPEVVSILIKLKYAEPCAEFKFRFPE